MDLKKSAVVGIFMMLLGVSFNTGGSTQTADEVLTYVSTAPAQYAFNDRSYSRTLNRAERRHQRGLPTPTTFESTVRLENGGICSGTVVGLRTVLTAAHCFPDAVDSVVVNGKEMAVKEIISDKSDHAFIIFSDDTPAFERIALMASYPSVGDDIFYWGNPDGRHQMLRRGYVASRLEDGFFVDSNTWLGDSGAGVFNRDGRLVGVVSAISGKHDPRAGGMGYKFMVALNYTFTAEQVLRAGILYRCEGCVLTH